MEIILNSFQKRYWTHSSGSISIARCLKLPFVHLWKKLSVLPVIIQFNRKLYNLVKLVMPLPIKICDKFCHIKGIVLAHTILMCFHKNEENKMEIVKPFERI